MGTADFALENKITEFNHAERTLRPSHKMRHESQAVEVPPPVAASHALAFSTGARPVLKH